MDDKSDNVDGYQLWLSLINTSDIIHRARDKELSKYGVSARQAAVLYTIHSLGKDATVGKISKWLFRKPQSISGILTRMEKSGLIKRLKDLQHKSVVRIEITEKGQELYALSTKRESIENIMSFLSKNESKNLKEYLSKLRRSALEELREEIEYI